MKKEIDNLIIEYAKAKQAYASEYMRMYDEGYKTDAAIKKKVDATPIGFAFTVLEKQLEYEMKHES